jgi:hypothetical protein
MRTAVPLAVTALLLAPSAALAHKMLVVATVTGTIRVEVHYEDKTPAEEATVTLKDEAGAVVAEGVTDAAGVCVLPRPKPGAYTIVADDGGGHRRREPLVIPDESAPAEARTALGDRWLMTAVGLAVIAAGTLTAWWVLRRR